eukprot:14279144-Alexandrium_andersonii.AAC.1
MVVSCRSGEVFTWADSLRHLLQGARAGRSQRPLEPDSSDSDCEGPRVGADDDALLRTAWTTSPAWP